MQVYISVDMEGIDNSFGVVFFVGYHQRDGGGDGVANHTFLGKIVQSLTVNGEPVDEANAVFEGSL